MSGLGLSTAWSTSSTAWVCAPFPSGTLCPALSRRRASAAAVGPTSSGPPAGARGGRGASWTLRRRRHGQIRQERLDRQDGRGQACPGVDRPRPRGVCADHPFFSTDDWAMVIPASSGGCSAWHREHKWLPLQRLDPGALFARIRVASRASFSSRRRPRAPARLPARLRNRLSRRWGVLIFDEKITGFRWHETGLSQSTTSCPTSPRWGKALSNGFGRPRWRDAGRSWSAVDCGMTMSAYSFFRPPTVRSMSPSLRRSRRWRSIAPSP